MTIDIITSDTDKRIYDTKVSHPLQSWKWGEAREKMGLEVLRVGEYNQGHLVSVYQISFHKIPFTPYKIGYIPRSQLPSRQILNWLLSYGKKNNVIFFKFEPNIVKNNITIKQFSNFIVSPHPLFPLWTQVIDLTKTKEELLETMKPKTRYNIRIAEKKGVVVKEQSDNEGFKIFLKLYFETCKRQKYYGHNPDYHRTVWKHLNDGIAHILIAFYNKEPLAAYELFYFNKTLYYPYGGTSLSYRNLMASNLLMWKAILFGKELEATTFDMWGSLPPTYDNSHSWAGFTRFKEGYNTQFVEMVGSLDFVVDRPLYSLYTSAYKVRSFFLSF